MAHQSGITCSVELKDELKNFLDGSTNMRVIKIVIQDELLQCKAKKNAVGNLSQDYDKMVESMKNGEKEAFYLLIKTDEPHSNSKDNKKMLALILFAPDCAVVKDKMLYASTKNTLKSFIGSDLIKYDIFASTTKELTYDYFLKQAAHDSAAAPLTDGEILVKQMKEDEVSFGLIQKAETLPGLSFPIDQDALHSFDDFFNKKSINYVQLSVDVKNERIHLVDKKRVNNYSELSSVTCNEPRYHLILFNYTHENSSMSNVVFIYTMPGYSTSIKDRMMYSSCKAPLLAYIEGKYREIAKKLECSDMSEVSDDFLYEELHPREAEKKNTFEKPKRPGGRR